MTSSRPAGPFSRHRARAARRGRAAVARLTVICLVLASGVGILLPATPAAADGTPDISLSKTAPGTVLVGMPVTYTLTVTNPAGAVPAYNLALRDVLPAGMALVPGSTVPADAGDPSVIADQPALGETTLIWNNIADVGPNGSYVLTFKATPDPATYPVGSSVSNNADAYVNSNARFEAEFDSNGAVIEGTDSFTGSATATSPPTAVTAYEVTKSEPSPEAELLRGVHDQTTVYTLQVHNNPDVATDGTVVDDYLPAGLEFLACGGVDNTTDQQPEYAGAPTLEVVPPAGPDCLTPAAVDTVTDPAGLPAGVYTKVTWAVGDLGPDGSATITYRAGIPLRANTDTWPSGRPPAGSGEQGANLDNNEGAPTAEGGSESSLTNYVQSTGTYQGPVAGGGSTVTAQATHAVTIEDLAMAKSVAPTTFDGGGIATYTLVLRSGEYRQIAGMAITDVLPNGVCPLSATQNFVTGAPADCAPEAGFAPTNATIDSVTQRPDGTFSLMLVPSSDLAANGTLTITYQGRMRTTYTGTGPASGPDLTGLLTADGDSFTNDATVDGTSEPLAGPDPPDPATDVIVYDGSSTTQTSEGGGIDKQIAARTVPMECASASYEDPAVPDPNPPFHLGDRICFRLRVNFAPDNPTRNPVVTDFIPRGTSYEARSQTVTPANTVPAEQVSFNEGLATGTLQAPTWQLGQDDGQGGRIVAPGAVFEVDFSVLVTDPGTDITRPLEKQNLMKVRTQNTLGQTISRRDTLTFRIAPPPPLVLLKGVSSVDGLPAAGNPPNVDGAQVQQGSVVGFRIDIANGGTALAGNDQTVRALHVLDALPAGIDCGAISVISDGGQCFDAGAAGRPDVLPATAAVLSWVLPPTDTIAAGATRPPLTYSMTVPAVASVSTVLTDTAGVSQYDVDTDIVEAEVPRTATFFPTSNIDQGVTPSTQNAPPASDPSNVVLADATVTKSGTTSIIEQNNDTPNQAVVGELVTYTAGVLVPTRTTVFNATLTDPLPTGIGFVSTSAGYSAAGTAPAPDPLPAGVTQDPATGALTFPPTYTNDTATDQLFQVAIVARVTTDRSNVNGVTRTNTATFASTTAETGGTAVTPRTATWPITVLEPNPTVRKKDDTAKSIVVSGQTVTFTLSATNPADRPPAKDTIVVDCVPSGLTFVAFGAPTQGTTQAVVDGDGTNACPVNTARLVWNVGILAPGTTPTLTYTATVDPAAAGSVTYTNTATLTAGTLENGKTNPVDPDDPLERTFVSQATDTITVAGAAVVKVVTPNRATIGERVSYAVGIRIPESINLYDSAVIDDLPAGIDPSTLVRSGFACSYPDGTDCLPTIPGGGAPLTPAAGPNGSSVQGWLTGDVLSDLRPRLIAITYSAVVKDIPANTAGKTLDNSVRAGWNDANGPDPTGADATFDETSPEASATVTVIEPSLSIAKTVNDTTPEPGQTFSYSLTLTNAAGPQVGDAYDSVVVDQLPTGIVVTPGTVNAGGVLDAGAGTITWTVPGPLAPGAHQLLGYQATLAGSPTLGTAALTNSATVQSYRSLPGAGRTYSGPTATAVVNPAFPQLTPRKAVVAGTTAYVGSPFGWRLTLTNSGTGVGYGVDAADLLPPNWTYDTGSARVSVNGAPATAVEPVDTAAASGHTLTWTNLGTLPPAKSIVVSYTATPGPDALTDPGAGLSVNHTNTVTTTAEDATGASGNAAGPYGSGTATAVAHVAKADLVVDKSHTDTFVAGSTGRWNVLVSNAGPDPAVGPFTVTDTVPAGLTLISATGTGWTCVPAAPVTCSRTNAAEALASGTSFPVITVTVAVSASAPAGTSYVNTVTAAARTYDPNPANNADSDTVTVTASADLEIAKHHANSAVAGAPLTWTFDVRNLGPSDSVGPITVTDVLPAGVGYAAAAGDGWVCGYDVPSRTVSCTRASTLALGDAAPAVSLDVTVDADRTGTISNTATVAGTTPDPLPGNNSATDPVVLDTEADLGIQKEHIGELIAGSTGTYQFRADNYGPSDAAAAVTITDPLPAGLTFTGTVTSIDGAWSCEGTTTVVCTLAGPLPANNHAIVQIGVALDSAATGTLVNTATVASPTPDPNPGNNTDTDSTEFTTQADLQIIKSHTGDATAGKQLTYSLAVTNNGPSDSPGAITVSDPIPDGMTYVSASGTGWSCAEAATEVTCTRADPLLSGAGAPPIELVVGVSPDAGPAVITNTASVDGPLVDPNPDNDVDDDPTTVNDLANVSIVKSAPSGPTLLAGQKITYLLHVVNDGPSTADDVTVADPWPALTTLVSATGDGWDCSATDPIVCSRDALVVGSSAAADITVTVAVASNAPDGTTVRNTSTVSTSTPGDDPADNKSSVDVTVGAKADLSLTKTHHDGPVLAGGTVSYDLDAHNAGPSDAVAPVTITDHLPPSMTYVAAAADWFCVAGAITDTGQVVACSLDNTSALAAGADAPTLTLTVLIDPAAPAGSYPNQAVVTSPTDDPNTENNTATDVVDAGTSANLSIVKSHNGSARVGDQLQFDMAVHNAGPSAATGVVLTDGIPTGLTYVSATGAAWACQAAPDVDPTSVTCTLVDSLDPDADAPPLAITFTVGAAAYPTVANIATVDSAVDDPDPADNTSTDQVAVPAQVDLAVTKTHTGAFAVGSTGQYAVTVVNNGPTDDPGPVTVADTLPAGLGYVSAAGDGWACAATGQSVSCVRATGLAVGGSSEITLVVNVLPAAFPSVANTATVSTLAEDVDPSNNTATDPADVAALVNLSLVKTVASIDGHQVVWSIVVSNAGPNDAQQPFVVTDLLPAELAYVDAAGDGFTCAVAGQLITCTHVGTLAVGAQSTLLVTTTVTAVAGTTVTNSASVSGNSDSASVIGVADLDTSNDTGSADLVVPTVSDSGFLPNTGFAVASYAATALLLLLAGFGLVLAVRRPRRSGKDSG